MATPCFLVLDQGGHASRAALYSTTGECLAAAEAPLATHRPQAGWVEHDPDEVIASCTQAIAALQEQAAAKRLVPTAAGLATQRSSIVLWARSSGRPLSPVLSWQDTRQADWLSGLGLDAGRIRALTGLVLSPHYGASKIRWCLDHLPAARKALARGDLSAGPLVSFVLNRLLVERPFVADPANASRTLLWDVNRGVWSPELCATFGIPRAILPELVPTRQAFGRLPFSRQSMPCTIPLTVATGDQSAALFAGGEPEHKTVAINIGTGAFVQRPAGIEHAAAAGLIASVAFADQTRRMTVLEGTVNGAGAALDWLAERHQRPLANWLPEIATWLEHIRSPPMFLNGIDGLGSPWWIATMPCRFSNDGAMAQTGGKDALPREAVAVIESIVFMLAVNCEHIAAASGRPDAIRISGGLSRLDGLNQRLATLTACEVHRATDHEATARGLTWLVAQAGSAWHTAPSDHFKPAPDPALKARYRAWRAWVEKHVGADEAHERFAAQSQKAPRSGAVKRVVNTRKLTAKITKITKKR